MDGWAWFVEMTDRNWPLAILVVCGLAVFRCMRWVGSKFVEPLGGPEGKVARWLDAQAAQHHATIDANKSLVMGMGEAVAQIRGIRASTEATERSLVETWGKAKVMGQDGLERLGRIEEQIDAVLRAKVCICHALSREAGDASRVQDLRDALAILDAVLDE